MSRHVDNLISPDLCFPEVPLADLSFQGAEVSESASTSSWSPLVAIFEPTRYPSAARAFHEQPAPAKTKFYRCDAATGLSFFSNVDLFHSKAASWRDTLQIRMAPVASHRERIPTFCREEVAMWDREVERLGGVLLGLFSEGLGLGATRLLELTCLGARVMVAHYYPYCPEPDLTVGIASHTDPGVLTVLLQDGVGGLRVEHGGRWLDVKLGGQGHGGPLLSILPEPDLTVGIALHTDPGVLTVLLQDGIGGLRVEHGGRWLDVKSVAGALVINVGDLLQF